MVDADCNGGKRGRKDYIILNYRSANGREGGRGQGRACCYSSFFFSLVRDFELVKRKTKKIKSTMSFLHSNLTSR